MNKKYVCFIILYVFFVSLIQATPDRQRFIIDSFIGLNGNNIIIHQLVYDNLQTHGHENHLIEEYIIEKFMENGITTIIKNIKITEQNNFENILLREYIGNIDRVVIPNINWYDKFQSIVNLGYIEMGKETIRRYNLIDHIPVELRSCTILRIVDLFFNDTYMYITIDLEDAINTYRKIIMIK